MQAGPGVLRSRFHHIRSVHLYHMPKLTARRNSNAEQAAAKPLAVGDDVRERSRSLIEESLMQGDTQKTDGNDGEHAHSHARLSSEAISRLAHNIEDEIFEANKAPNAYRQAIRSHLLTLRHRDNPLRTQLLEQQLDPRDFAGMSGEALASPERAQKDAELREQELRLHIAKPVEESINSVKDGRVRGKWGVEGSAAAIDS